VLHAGIDPTLLICNAASVAPALSAGMNRIACMQMLPPSESYHAVRGDRMPLLLASVLLDA